MRWYSGNLCRAPPAHCPKNALTLGCPPHSAHCFPAGPSPRLPLRRSPLAERGWPALVDCLYVLSTARLSPLPPPPQHCQCLAGPAQWDLCSRPVSHFFSLVSPSLFSASVRLSAERVFLHRSCVIGACRRPLSSRPAWRSWWKFWCRRIRRTCAASSPMMPNKQVC